MVEPREHAHEVATALPHRDLRVLQPGVGQEDKLVDVGVLGHVDQSAERQVRLEDRKSERVLLGAGWGAIPEELDSELAGVVVVAGLLFGVVESSNLDERLPLSDVTIANR